MAPVLFRIPDWIPLVGDQAITSFGVFLFAAFLVAGTWFVRRLQRSGAGIVGWDLVVTGAVAGLLGAKLVHLAVHEALGLPVSYGRGGLNWLGGLAVGVPAVLWHARRQGLDERLVARAAAPALALGYAVGRVGSFLVGADYGVPTALPWGVAFRSGTPPTTPANLLREFGAAAPAGTRIGDYVRVHPTQLYEAALSLVVLGLLVWLERHRNGSRVGGWSLFGFYLILAGAARAGVELVRLKRDQLAGPVTVDMILALALVAIGAALRTRSEPRAQTSKAA